MDNGYQLTIHDQREVNKLGLDTYFFGKTSINIYDLAIDKLIAEKKAEIEKSNAAYQNIRNSKEKQAGATPSDDYSAEMDMFYHIECKIHNEEELRSLLEMKIIYAYKFFEINIKNLLRASFDLKNSNNLYKWDNLVSFLGLKGINYEQIDGYKEINQLRIVNNTVKHSGQYDSKLSTVTEFSKSKQLTYESLDTFYERVKKCPLAFSQGLASAIHTVLYSFDESKLKKMATYFALRMTKADATKFGHELLNLYK